MLPMWCSHEWQSDCRLAFSHLPVLPDLVGPPIAHASRAEPLALLLLQLDRCVPMLVAAAASVRGDEELVCRPEQHLVLCDEEGERAL